MLVVFHSEGTYVRIIGSVRSFQDSLHVISHDTRAVADHNEITHHFLECVYRHCQRTKVRARFAFDNSSKTYFLIEHVFLLCVRIFPGATSGVSLRRLGRASSALKRRRKCSHGTGKRKRFHSKPVSGAWVKCGLQGMPQMDHSSVSTPFKCFFVFRCSPFSTRTTATTTKGPGWHSNSLLVTFVRRASQRRMCELQSTSWQRRPPLLHH